MKNEKITLENLAEMMKVSFDSIDGRFNSVDQKLDSVDQRLGSLEQGQENILLKLDNYAYKFEVRHLTKRVDKIEKSLL